MNNSHLIYRTLGFFLLLTIITCTPNFFVISSVSKALGQSKIDLTPVADTFIASGRADLNLSTYQAMWSGNSVNDGYGIERALIKFDVSQLNIPSGSKIDSAKFKLVLVSTTVNDSSLPIVAHRILSDWPETITWRNGSNLPFSALSSSTSVASTLGTPYEWNVTDMLQEWLDSTIPKPPFGLLLMSIETGEHDRGFWTKECQPSDCGTNVPQLEIQFSPPTVTPTNTPTDIPTHTPTPTFTPTPTPGISYLTLLADPTGEIQRGQEITYSIGYQNGGYALSNVSIENVIPTQLVLITDSFSYSGQIPGTPTIVDSKITWNVASTLPISASGSVSYRAARPTFSPTAILTTPASITDTPTAKITITPTNTNTPTRTPIVNTPTAINTLTPTATNPSTGTVSATSTPIPTVPTSQVAVEVVAIPNDPQNFEFVGSLGSFALDDAIPDDNDSITKRKTFDWKNANVPIVITQKTLISWTLYSVVCYPPGNTSLQAAAQNSTLTLDAGILATNESLYCVFINVRNDYLGSPASQATADALIRSVSVGLQGTPVPTAVPTVETLEPIVNEGATIHWVYEATPDALLSNSTRNPPIQMYLPIIAR